MAQQTSLELGVSVRLLQQKCKLSHLQTETVSKLLKTTGSGEADLPAADRKMKLDAGMTKVVLHGCVHVDVDGQHCQHVYAPRDKRKTCPRCGHARYTATKPNEMVYWFPLQPRLEALLKLPAYRRMLQVMTSAVSFVCGVARFV